MKYSLIGQMELKSCSNDLSLSDFISVNVTNHPKDSCRLKDIFYSNRYRNILLEIISHLTYDEISNLLYLDKNSRSYMKYFLYQDENKIIVDTIVNRRFFDRGEGKFILNESFLQPKFTISNDKTFWKRYYPNIGDGDIIYLSKCDKFVHMNSSKIFIRYKWDNKCSGKDCKFIFPIEYWKRAGRLYPFRLWITVKVYYESLREWLNDSMIRFIDLDLDPKLYQDDNPIEICFTYVEEIIYIYKGRN